MSYLARCSTIRILVALTALWAPVAFAAPPVSPPVALPGDLAIAGADGEQGAPTLVRGGNQFLAVWVDNRTSFSGEQNGNDLYAARLDADGNLIDTTPIAVDQTYGYQRAPQVAWNGENWLVVYERQETPQTYYETVIRAVRVSPQGAVLDASPILVYGSGYAGMFAVTSNGTNWCVVSNTGGGNGVVGRRISAAGAILDATPVTLVPSTYFWYANIRVVSAQGEYLVTFSDNGNQIWARRFSAALAPLAPAFAVPSSLIASNGSDYFIVFFGGNNEMVGSRMSHTGTLLDPAGVLITDGTKSPFETDLTWSGTYWWVSWIDGFSGPSAARITPQNQVVDYNGVILDPTLKDQVATHDIAPAADGGIRMVFYDHRLGALEDRDIAATSYSVAGQPGPRYTISNGAPTQTAVDLAYGPGEFLAVHVSRISDTMRVLAQRLDGYGQAIDPQPVVVVTGSYAGRPRAAWNGQAYAVVWSDGYNVLARRFDPQLVPLDASPITVMPGGSPDIAALGQTFLVAAVHTPANPQYRFPYARRLDGTTGALLDPAPLGLGNSFASLPRVARFGNRWIVVWQRNYTHDDPQGQLQGAWIDLDGMQTPEFVVTYNGFQPDIAVAGDVALVVSRRNSAANANNDVQAVRMLIDGTMPAAPFTVSAAAGRQTNPAVTWDGAQFLVTWEDQRNQLTFYDPRTDVYALRIDKAGQILDPDAFPILNGAEPEILPAVASGGEDTLIGVPTFHAEAPFAAYRIGILHTPGTFTDPPQAKFTGQPREGCVPLQVQFTDESLGNVSAWSWSFGDGGTSTQADPVHTYSTPGIYSVALSASGSLGWDTAGRVDYIVAATPAQANFQASPTVVCAPVEKVQFTDLSAGFPEAWIWDFGDNTYSTEQSPSHAYAWPGTYTVRLTVFGSCGSHTKTLVNYVQVDPPCGWSALALSDIGVASSLAGDYTRTHVQDNLWEVMYEVLAGSGSASYSVLDHRWDFDVVPGASVTFHARTFRNPPWETEGFRLEYSTNNADFLTLVSSVPVGYREFTVPLPDTLNGTVYVRVVDTNHTPGNTAADGIFIDYMDIETETVLPPIPCEAVTQLMFTDPDSMQWAPAPGATHYDIVRGDLGALRINQSVGDADCVQAALPAMTWTDGAVPPPGGGFYYIIRAEVAGGAPGTYDNPGPPPVGFEGRDAEMGSAGGTTCSGM